MSFTFPGLAVAGALLALAPIVIHLLNRRRRRRVAWGAMEFLLQSDRKNRTWLRLCEWLLLAARAAAIALAGVAAALPMTADPLAGFFGAGRQRHVVVLDDTCSMRRRDGETTAWEQALAALGRLADRAEAAGDEVLVVRYTDPLTGSDSSRLSATPSADPSASPAGWRGTWASASPADAFERAADLCSSSAAGVRTNAYVLSDFAASSHPADGDAAESLRRIAATADGLALGSCGDPATPNVAVASVRLEPGPVAADVETRVVVEVVNHSDDTIPDTAVVVTRDGKPLATVEVGPFAPRERRLAATPITLRGEGLHVVEAATPADRFPADDTARMAIDVPATQLVALLDDSRDGLEALVFGDALRPRGATRTGWTPRRVTRLDDGLLGDVACVLILDAPGLGPQPARELREFIDAGGGVLFVVGPRTDAERFNERFAETSGGDSALAPWRLGPVITAPAVEEGESLLEVSDHPALRGLRGAGESLLPLVRLVAQRRLVEADPAPAALRRVAARPASRAFDTLVRRSDGEPLVVECRHGRGRVMAMLTVAATGSGGPEPWSNLATLPLFPIFVNDLVGWLAQERLRPIEEVVGRASVPAAEASRRVALEAHSSGGVFTPATPLGPVAPLAPSRPGVYRRVGAGVSPRPFAVGIDPRESDLRAATVEELRTQWGAIARVARVADLFRDDDAAASRGPLYAAAVALLSLMAAERWLAYRSSHVNAAAGGTP